MRSNDRFWRTVVALVVFSVAFGYLEAAVVAYLRSLYLPLRAHFYPTVPASELFPLLTLDQLRGLGPEHELRLHIELGREFATLLMLGAVGLAVANKPREWVAAFVVCFGMWDLAFYAFLKLLLNWPASLLTWDILFLLPAPWVGPVLAPILVSVSMIVAGLYLLWREHSEKPLVIGRAQWILIVLGGLTIIAAFIFDFPNTATGGSPRPFHWTLFFLGEAISLLAFAWATRRKERGR